MSFLIFTDLNMLVNKMNILIASFVNLKKKKVKKITSKQPKKTWFYDKQ